MRIPLSWLREYVRVDATAEEIVDALSVSTAEVHGVQRAGVPGDPGFFRVGHVLEAAKHPDADRLQLTSVDVGEDRPYSIVCGAWNFGAGAKVAVALPGATLPNGLVLERRKLRGELSEGMILAEDELDLGADHTGIIVLDDALEAGTPLADVLPLVDEVLDLDPTGNRPDLFAVYGVAREVATLLGGELAPMPGEDPEQEGDEPVGIGIDDPEGCLRFIGRTLRDVTMGESPLWLKGRLRNAGVRSISNVVDVTNYVMLALGSPLHAYDLDRLRGGLVARRARAGEKLRTLDGVERTLSAEDLVIADAGAGSAGGKAAAARPEDPAAFGGGGRAVGLAGIMGGEETEVSGSTKNVLLEAANFEPVGILRSSERHSLRTEGSNRWEKGVDPYVAGQAATYATQLIVELSGARWTGAEDVQANLPKPAVIRLRPERASTVIGLEVPASEQAEILVRLGFEQLKSGFRVPTWRARDVTREVDLIEEVARFKLPEVPFTLPRRQAMFGRLTRPQRLRRLAEDALLGAGYAEVYTPSFVADGDLRLPEPLSAEAAALRTVLYASLLEPARRNADAGDENVALFEVARVYRANGGDLPVERWHLAGIADGGFAEAKWAVEHIYSALGIEPTYERTSEKFLHPGKAARTAEGWLGELHPTVLDGTWSAFELDLDALAEAAPQVAAFEPVSPYPEVRQDLAFVVDEEVPAAELSAAIREAAGELLRELEVFDEYRGEQIGEGKRSLAFRLAFGSPEGTLTDEDVAPVRASIVDALATRFDAVLRA
ncbi:MAG TPA: phenylalanine--tRNA ligase subunit beta [Gaiellaceae bacterium]|nr:phenylalanine--tRNA ligase subunit beta [Gaiellaceae bacterium]